MKATATRGGGRVAVVIGLCGLVGLAGLVAAQLAPAGIGTIEEYSPVTAERLLDPEPHNWLMYRRTYDGTGYSPLDQIDRENVAQLRPVWTMSTGVTEGHESPPVVNDGVMFVTTPQNQVIALNAATGELYWRYRRELPEGTTMIHPTNRGVGLWNDKVYIGTLDAYVVALDAASGEVVWETQVEDTTHGYYITLAPLVVEGKVLVGVSGGERGIRGFVQAFDAESGESLWKTFTVPGPGEPGNETWPGDTWQTGGAPVWSTGNYDPDARIAYFGTGNGAPWTGDTRPGDNLYATSTIGLDIDTGEIVTYFQYQPNDSWDWDEVVAPILIDLERDGRTFPAAIKVGRSGYLWVLDRSDGQLTYVDAWPYVEQNVFQSIDPETGQPVYDPARKPSVGSTVEFCPSLWGGRDWPPEAYNPQTGLLYIPANENHCGSVTGVEVEYEPGQGYTGAQTTFNIVEGADHIGELQAWDLRTGQEVWTATFESANWGPVLTTAGGLVFMGGTSDRMFRAFDAETGDVLWEFRTNSGVTGVPTTFEVDGVQYVAVQSGWGVDAQRMQSRMAEQFGWSSDVPQGGAVWVFALPDQAAGGGDQ